MPAVVDQNAAVVSRGENAVVSSSPERTPHGADTNRLLSSTVNGTRMVRTPRGRNTPRCYYSTRNLANPLTSSS
jgi:hypothetical protein